MPGWFSFLIKRCVGERQGRSGPLLPLAGKLHPGGAYVLQEADAAAYSTITVQASLHIGADARPVGDDFLSGEGQTDGRR